MARVRASSRSRHNSHAPKAKKEIPREEEKKPHEYVYKHPTTCFNTHEVHATTAAAAAAPCRVHGEWARVHGILCARTRARARLSASRIARKCVEDRRLRAANRPGRAGRLISAAAERSAVRCGAVLCGAVRHNLKRFDAKRVRARDRSHERARFMRRHFTRRTHLFT